MNFLLAVCLLVISAEAATVKYCDKKENYDVKVDAVHISPDPVVAGESATFNILASAGKTISGGKLHLDVSYFGVLVHRETRNLCEETSCPIAIGKFELSHTQTLPGITPPGSYTLKMKMEDEKKHELTCIRFGFKVGVGSHLSSI